MVKITNRNSLGIQPVCDIGVKKDHNFILSNGLVASNCFNKSHAISYAYLTCQTAYLKANYPVEYMSALLTASSDRNDTREKYIINCRNMGIDILPPDINRSQKDFTPVGDKIIFGLSAIRGIGYYAIANIIQAREEAGGQFTSLIDFCDRIDLETVRRSTIENLILVGAFDNLHSNRKELIDDLDLTLKSVKNPGKSIINKKTNLAVQDFSLEEKIEFEINLLGFSISESYS